MVKLCATVYQCFGRSEKKKMSRAVKEWCLWLILILKEGGRFDISVDQVLVLTQKIKRISLDSIY